VTGLFTSDGKRHVRRMLHSLTPCADRLERRFRPWLKKAGCDAAQATALLAITPAAAARMRSLAPFFKQVAYSGKRLAKLNLSPAVVSKSLQQFDRLAGDLLEGRFAPAREQLQLATQFALKQAYYEVREAESQAFFDLFRAETQAADLDDLLSRFVRVLTKAFHAAAGRLKLEEQAMPEQLQQPLYIERDQPDHSSLVDRRLRGRYVSYWSYPFGPSAVLQLGFTVPYPWLPREQALLAAAAARCREAIERTRMTQQIRRLQAESLRTEEEERRRIGRDLHDEAGQALAFLRLQLEMMERDAPDRLRARLSEARELAGRTTIELRRIVSALSPSALERLGLRTALRLLVKRFRYTHGIAVEYRAGTLPAGQGMCPLPLPAQEVIYRVAQESLQNVAKHSGASRVNISFRGADKKIRLSVRDNGAGFSPDRALLKPRSFGLAGMRERAMLLGGTLTLKTAPGKGTEVRLELPAPVIGHGKNSRIVD
jgi:signal transduction histidine kinase